MKVFISLLLIILLPSLAISEVPDEYKVDDLHTDDGFRVATYTLDNIDQSLGEFVTITDLFLNDNVRKQLDEKGVAQLNIKKRDIENLKKTGVANPKL